MEKSTSLFHNSEPKPALQAFLRELGIDQNGSPEDVYCGLEAWRDEHRLRPFAKSNPPLAIMQCLRELGLTEPIEPPHADYDVVVVVGARVDAVEERIGFLADICERGVKPHAVLLASPLSRLKPDEEHQLRKCYQSIPPDCNRVDMMRCIYLSQLHRGRMPNCSYTRLVLERPLGNSNADVLSEALRKNIDPHNRVLLVLSQPTIGFRTRRIARDLEDLNLRIIGCGPTAISRFSLGLYVSAIAKHVFQECLVTC